MKSTEWQLELIATNVTLLRCVELRLWLLRTWTQSSKLFIHSQKFLNLVQWPLLHRLFLSLERDRWTIRSYVTLVQKKAVCSSRWQPVRSSSCQDEICSSQPTWVTNLALTYAKVLSFTKCINLSHLHFSRRNPLQHAFHEELSNFTQERMALTS